MTVPVFLSTSPQLTDYDAASYQLDYTLGGNYPAAVFSIAHCAWCNKRYALAPQPGGWAIFIIESHGLWPPLALEASQYPLCVSSECVASARILEVVSLHSIVTKEGEWINLPRGIEMA